MSRFYREGEGAALPVKLLANTEDPLSGAHRAGLEELGAAVEILDVPAFSRYESRDRTVVTVYAAVLVEGSPLPFVRKDLEEGPYGPFNKAMFAFYENHLSL